MSKTDDLNKAFEDAIPMLAESDLATVLEVNDWMKPASPASPGVLSEIHFPTPSPSWGIVTCYVMANPHRRWWSFWRPRTITIWAKD
jgi:hypothetical protein